MARKPLDAIQIRVVHRAQISMPTAVEHIRIQA
jgi:hypothetical protein